jgi:L-ascorbate metabolism protein UlaG (beta-lactamase superfamily)
MKLKWLGHAGFKIDDLMIDPWMKEALGLKPSYNFKEEDKEVKLAVITHNHDDHFAGIFEVAKEKDIILVSTPETVMPAMQQGIKAEMMNIGGPITVAGWKITLVLAFHTGGATGAILEKNGTVIYHAGDTGLFGDMKLIGEIYKPDVALLPIGGRFTMDEEQAAKAAEFLGAKKVIPMHYNTFPMILADPEKFKKLTKAEVIIMKVGEEIEI